MTDPNTRIQEHLGIALRNLSLYETRVTQGQDGSRDAARTLAELQRVAHELNLAFDALRRERERVASMAADAEARTRRAQKLFVESPSACLVVHRGGAVIQEANAAASRLLNVSQRHLIGKPFTNFLQHDREMFLRYLQGGADTASRQWHVTLRPRERATLRARERNPRYGRIRRAGAHAPLERHVDRRWVLNQSFELKITVLDASSPAHSVWPSRMFPDRVPWDCSPFDRA